jgi:hypothetical protein
MYPPPARGPLSSRKRKIEVSSQGNDGAWWTTGAWLTAWSIVGHPPLEQPVSEAHAAAMCEQHMETPLRALSETHWERERSGVFLAVIDAIQHHADKVRYSASALFVFELIFSIACHTIVALCGPIVHQDCTVLLVDPTGRAQAYLHCSIVADAGADLTTGAVVLVKRAALLHTRDGNRIAPLAPVK